MWHFKLTSHWLIAVAILLDSLPRISRRKRLHPNSSEILLCYRRLSQSEATSCCFYGGRWKTQSNLLEPALCMANTLHGHLKCCLSISSLALLHWEAMLNVFHLSCYEINGHIQSTRQCNTVRTKNHHVFYLRKLTHVSTNSRMRKHNICRSWMGQS